MWWIQQCYKNQEIGIGPTVIKQQQCLYCKVFAWKEGRGWEEWGSMYFLLKRQRLLVHFLLLLQKTELLTSTYILLKSHMKVAQVQKTNPLENIITQNIHIYSKTYLYHISTVELLRLKKTNKLFAIWKTHILPWLNDTVRKLKIFPSQVWKLNCIIKAVLMFLSKTQNDSSIHSQLLIYQKAWKWRNHIPVCGAMRLQELAHLLLDQNLGYH